ncbi:unnamed protein product [Ceutorhynchus assimilis]|uniref:Acylglycerol kinase, mitochondrial n=1 Tax=Ceutorhynchus assimilis TaxID=467358 RepID=A0A9N9MMC9_9CUCU|nr:unnamed protein product [Ceutorhynchus assimilis]
MAFIIKTVKTLRNNWKKSTFFAVVLTWGGNYTKNYFDTQALMTAYCAEAARHGHQTIPVTTDPRKVTVILNPSANKRTAQADFDSYCAPLLHLAGINVEVVRTESEGHAKRLMETLNGAEAVVVAGGDGTLSEVVTGLMRRTNENAPIPVGILPLGKNNSIGRSLFPGLEKVTSLAEATMAVIEEFTKQMDVMRIEILNDGEEKRAVYAVSGIKWGAYRDAEVKKDSYWYFGGLKKYATYIFNGLKSSLSWNCEAQLLYSPPCTGCTNCHKKQPHIQQSKWFQRFIKDQQTQPSLIDNPECSQQLEKKISTSDLTLFTSNVIPSSIQDSRLPHMNLSIGPGNVDYVNFVKQGWRFEHGEKREVSESIEARTIEINPENLPDKEIWFSIDNEDYEVKPIRVTLLPNVLKMYYRKK